MKIFTVGPVQSYPSTAEIRLKGFPYFRTEEFSDVMLSNSLNLKKMMNASDLSEVVNLASSGTGAMEAVVDNCLLATDKCLVINGGTFGKRFCELLHKHSITFDSIDLDWNESLTQEHLNAVFNNEYTALLVNIHETSTGQLYPVKMLADFCKKKNMYFIVDAISSFLADNFDMQENGMDVAIVSSQKGLCLSPGMSMVVLSERMKQRVQLHSNPTFAYFDFRDYFQNNLRGQTPFTPTVCIAYELQDMINLIQLEGGINNRLKFVKDKCEYFRKKIKEAGLSYVDSYSLSNMLTPMYFDDIDAYEIFKMLKNDFGIYVNPCGGRLASKILRIAHIGNTTFEDFDFLIEKISVCINRIKNS
ncbi:MAG: alanine--glyoxylate aminotransferase family protein [Verrucomicrobiaceae bacterium]|nr:alanine--glyoxylate aminotransferase family protein [Verrucomicrobiaceae bacterium]